MDNLQLYSCDICGLVYDPVEGDADSEIEAGTPFANLPEDWGCPLCGASKNAFLAVDQ